jgi:hypothetical protein
MVKEWHRYLKTLPRGAGLQMGDQLYKAALAAIGAPDKARV